MTDLPKITPAENGPLIVENAPRLSAADGTDIATPPEFGLCRCGASANKPFCDGSHHDAKSSDDDADPTN
ncbi:MAG: CDGSH iron-sulfur domain-containing protein [Roseicyclus sp.]